MKFIFFVTGMPGSGKTVLAKFLSKYFSAPRLDYDSLNKYYLDCVQAQLKDFTIEHTQRILRDYTHKTLLCLSDELIEITPLIFIAATFTNEKYHDPTIIVELKDKLGNSVKFIDIEIKIKPEDLYTNIIERNEIRDTHKIENWNKFISKHINQSAIWKMDYTIVCEFDRNQNKYEEIKINIENLMKEFECHG